MISRNRILANRENGLKGGVKTPEGKAISRLNARKHGIFASALTPEDAKGLRGIEDRLVAELKPVGAVEEMLVEKLALTYLRIQRCARAEADYHTRIWREPNIVINEYEWDQIKRKRDCGMDVSAFRPPLFKEMVELIGLYDVRLTNQFLKLLHEIERRQRLRGGENVPPPVVGDLTIHTDAGGPRERDADSLEEASTPAHDVSFPSPAVEEGRQKS